MLIHCEIAHFQQRFIAELMSTLFPDLENRPRFDFYVRPEKRSVFPTMVIIESQPDAAWRSYSFLCEIHRICILGINSLLAMNPEGHWGIMTRIPSE